MFVCFFSKAQKGISCTFIRLLCEDSVLKRLQYIIVIITSWDFSGFYSRMETGINTIFCAWKVLETRAPAADGLALRQARWGGGWEAALEPLASSQRPKAPLPHSPLASEHSALPWVSGFSPHCRTPAADGKRESSTRTDGCHPKAPTGVKTLAGKPN